MLPPFPADRQVNHERWSELDPADRPEFLASAGLKGTTTIRIPSDEEPRSADTPLAACVEKAIRAATFPPSSGLRFDYRIDCR